MSYSAIKTCLQILVAGGCIIGTTTWADATGESDTPKSRIDFFALPIEVDIDSGAANGDATILRIIPVYSLPLGEKAKIVNLNLITLADAPGGVPGRPGNPDPVSGDRATGFGDLIHASFYTPDGAKSTIWGLGAILSIPTASDKLLGSGKWSAGPAARFVYRTDKWNLGALGGQLWSFGGDSSRNDISQLLVRGAIRRKLSDDWFFVSAPVITANWKVEKGQKWLIPLGGGFGRLFSVNNGNWAWSVQAYYNVVKPDGAPNWVLRFAVISAIPLD